MEGKKTAQQRYTERYLQAKTFRFSIKTEQDILQRLEEVPCQARYIKDLIRFDIKAGSVYKGVSK